MFDIGLNIISFVGYVVLFVQFKLFYVEGMVLVEEIVSYFDGLGCVVFKVLLCQVLVFYVVEFMCFIICFMQMVFWFFLQCVVNNGEMICDQVMLEKKKVCFDVYNFDCEVLGWEDLLFFFCELIECLYCLQSCVVLFDCEIYCLVDVLVVYDNQNSVQVQFLLLQIVFGCY